jgi:hypothetical protein
MKQFGLIVSIAAGLILSGCGSFSDLLPGSGEAYTYNGVNFGTDRSETFKQGVQDGCATAGGKYAKNHTLFRSNNDYKVGWEDGRLKCGTKN